MTRRRKMPRENEPDSRRRAWLAKRARDLGFCVGIFLLTLVVYWPTLRGEFLWDDPAHVTREALRDWNGLQRIFFEPGATQEYYPVLHGAFWVQHRLWGDAVTLYHVLNIFLHATNCCLLAFLLRKILPMPAVEPGAAADVTWIVPRGTEWLAAVLFAVHPVCVESVAWITEQKNTLSMAFYLLAALCYLDFCGARRSWKYWLALGLFLLALGAKTMTVTLPAAMLVVLWWQHGRLTWRRDVRPLLPWFAAAIAAGLVTLWVETKWVGAEGADYELTLVQRALLAPKIFWFSLGKLLWPVDLTFFYPRWDVATAAFGWIIHLVAGMAVTITLWLLRRRSRGPLAAWLLYGGTLVPVLGFFNVFSFSFSYVADHYQYLAIPIIVAAGAAAFSLGLARLPRLLRPARPIAVGLMVVVLAVLTHRQSRLYQDDETLFRANIAANPTSWMGHHILAHTLLKKSPEHRADAEALYRRALQLKTSNPDSHYKLGVLLAQRPETRDEAIQHYEEALRLRPTFAEVHHSLAVELHARPGRLLEAIDHYQKAVQLRPGFVHAHANLAQALAQVPGREAEALTQFHEALRLWPTNAAAHFNLATLLATLPGRDAEAVSHFEAALRSRPDSPETHASLANILAKQPGRLPAALRHYEMAIQLQPAAGEFHALLGNALVQANQLPAAVPHLEAALQLDPDSAGAHYNLANALAFLPGRQPDAIFHYEAALRLRPDAADVHANLANVLALQPERLPEALTHYEKALQLAPNLAWVHYNLALHLSGIPGREPEALAHGEAALGLKPDYVEVHNLLGIMNAQSGQIAAARTHWNEALRIDPGFAPARENLSRLTPGGER